MSDRWREAWRQWSYAALASVLVAAGSLGVGIAARAQEIAGAPRAADLQDQLISLPTRPGVTVDLFLVRPHAEPVASAILFTGGDGSLGLASRALNFPGGNFLVRTRKLFAAQGFLVAVVDTPSDHAKGYGIFRTSDDHARDIAAVIAYLRHEAAVPVWLVGTSLGTISAAAVAQLQQGGADGLVLTSTVTRPVLASASVSDLDLSLIRLPTLIVAHRSDGCKVTPPYEAERLQKRFTAAPKVEYMQFEGGEAPRSDPCEAYSQHGYFGIEGKVVRAISNWIKAAPTK